MYHLESSYGIQEIDSRHVIYGHNTYGRVVLKLVITCSWKGCVVAVVSFQIVNQVGCVAICSLSLRSQQSTLIALHIKDRYRLLQWFHLAVQHSPYIRITMEFPLRLQRTSLYMTIVHILVYVCNISFLIEIMTSLHNVNWTLCSVD